MIDLVGKQEDRFSRDGSSSTSRRLQQRVFIRRSVADFVNHAKKRRNQKEIPTPKTEMGKIRYLNLKNIS